jgi:hypothetical protein
MRRFALDHETHAVRELNPIILTPSASDATDRHELSGLVIKELERVSDLEIVLIDS